MAALALWEYCEQSARYIFGGSLGDRLADRIERAMKDQPNGLTKTEIHGLLGRNSKAEELNHALNTLVNAGRSFVRIESTNGRSAERWFLRDGGVSDDSTK